MPDATPPVNRNRRSLSRSSYTPRFWTSSELRFDTSTVVPLRSSSCLLPDQVYSRPFPSAFTTLPFEQSRRRWFGTCSCKPVPRGRPSSVEQLRTSSAFRPFAVLVAHYNRVPFTLSTAAALRDTFQQLKQELVNAAAFCRSHPRLVPMNMQSGILCDPCKPGSLRAMPSQFQISRAS